MSLRQKLTSVRLIAVTSCVLAFGAYGAFAPTPTRADIAPLEGDGGGGVTCTYAGLPYSEGACRPGQRCMNNGNGIGVWVDDGSCK
jgi:hypothetical protein